MSEGVGALGFAQTPEGNYDSILKAQSQVNRQAASMIRSQMSQINRAETQAIKAQKEATERIEELQSDAVVTYPVTKHADIIGTLAQDIGVEDTMPMMARANQGLFPTSEQTQNVQAHKNQIQSFQSSLSEEMTEMMKRGYYNMPTFKEAYRGHLEALSNGEVPGFERMTIVDGAPLPSEYMFGTGGVFRPLGDEVFTSFIIEPQYWSYWFDKNAQETKSTMRSGGTQGATNVTESVSATTNQFTTYDANLKGNRAKTATEIINEGLLNTWFAENGNYEGAMLLRKGAMNVIAEHKAMDMQGIGSGYIVIDGQQIKVSDIDPADNGNPLAFTYLQAQVLSDRVAKYAMDNTSVAVSDIERTSFTIINSQNNQEINDAAYTNKFNQLADIYNNNDGVLNSMPTILKGGTAVKDISENFSGIKFRNKAAKVYFNPENKTFMLEYEETMQRGRKRTVLSEPLSVNQFAESATLFPGYSFTTASKFLARNKAFDGANINTDVLGGQNPEEVGDMNVVYDQLKSEWTTATSSSSMSDISRGVKTLLRTYDNAIPVRGGLIVGISVQSEKEQTFDVKFNMDGKSVIETFTIEQLRKIGETISPSMGQSSSVGQFDALPLDPEQLKQLNRLV